MDFERDIRFALVLYGGASLAVYIHGVTLEFFHLVRATAVDSNGNPLLSDAELSATERVYRKLGSLAGARFLVDIASGTSAGGINAIFLGKALANGQSLDRLSELWIDQADASDLLNRDKLPRSLLSSQTMHARILDALAGMERDSAIPLQPLLQPEMDVFITATDIQGLELPIELADQTVFEKRHKNVFHLRFGDGENHFTQEKNSYLAFAACATSAFPLAFEPVCLNGRAFSDGGCLDNKPFSYAMQALSQRSSNRPVARKLMYVEPSPDIVESDNPTGPPDFLRNTLNALFTLPREETIREDLQRVIDRNRLIERVRDITSHVDEDVREFVGRVGGAEYQRRTLADEIRDRGPGYAGYHRLKVRAVTDDLAAMLGQPREELEAWRRAHYSEEDPERSESAFLLQYDLGYRERRLRYLVRKLTDPRVKKELDRIGATLKSLRRLSVTTAERIADRFGEAFIRAASDAEACLDPESRRTFDQFEYYDQIVFPIFYEASVGEGELCEVFRISPRDATSILDENSPAEKRRKLAGTALFHFGAFLSREWRQNDLMWGRLDTAEGIIHCVLPPGSPEASALTHEANLAIVGSHPALTRLHDTYEVNRKLPVFKRLKLAFTAGQIILKMFAAYFIRTRQ